MPENSISPNQLATIRSALEPDYQSKAAYIGRISQTETVTVFSEDGTPFEKEVTFLISWDSTSKILDLIRKRARL